jgi:hypothetical protein
VKDVDGSLMVLADQVRRAVAWVYENAARLASTRTSYMSVVNPLVGILPR